MWVNMLTTTPAYLGLFPEATTHWKERTDSSCPLTSICAGSRQAGTHTPHTGFVISGKCQGFRDSSYVTVLQGCSATKAQLTFRHRYQEAVAAVLRLPHI